MGDLSSNPNLIAGLLFALATACVILMLVARHFRMIDAREHERRAHLFQHHAEQARRPK